MVIVTINNDLTAMEGVTEVPFKFEYDSSSGKYGYRDGADTFRPFNDGGGSDPVLLWTNPNPNTSYAGGTISNYSKSQYPYVIIESKYSYTSDDYHVTTIFDTTKSNPYGNQYWFGNRGVNASIARVISINDDNLTIGQGYAINGSTIYNANAIPLKVWGCESAIPSGKYAIEEIIGHTVRVSSTWSSSAQQHIVTGYYDGEVIFSQSVTAYTTYTGTVKESTSVTKPWEGGYKITCGKVNDSNTINIIINGYALYTGTPSSLRTSIDSGNITIQ